MKKLSCFVTLGLMAASFAGCNRAWPGCFGLLYRTPETYQTYCDESCDPCETYYSEPETEWVPATPPAMEPLPTPAPPKEDSSDNK